MQLTRRREDGFTLIELLIVIAIMGIIAVPMGNLIISYLRSNGDTEARLSESHDAQISAAYLQQDVASLGVRDFAAPAPNPFLQSVELDAPATGGLYPCGVAGQPNAVLRLAWDDFTGGPNSGPVEIRVGYLLEAVAGQSQLHRITCAGSSTIVSDTVLAHNVTSAAVSCPVTCTGSGANLPSSLTLSLTIHDPAGSASNYLVALTGQRRQT